MIINLIWAPYITIRLLPNKMNKNKKYYQDAQINIYWFVSTTK